ncbi:MAG: DNA-directed RNA polymerase subunit alpha [Dehalococcoidia bacterium]
MISPQPLDGEREGVPSTQLATPQIEIEEANDTYARVVAEPLEAGFGTTIGNALRRVLLSSLPGAAITSVRIEEVEHEFSTVPGIKEDTMEFLLAVKEIRLRGLSDRPGKLYLEASGEGRVTAGDIAATADYEIVNPELHLATLDSPDAHLTVEFTVEQGHGYWPATEREPAPIGVIPVDAIFTPIRKVNYQVERTRVGQVTDYDRLVLEVWTDGTVTGSEAVSRAAGLLIDQLVLYSQIGKPQPAIVERGLGVGAALSPDRYNTPIEQLNLSVRAYNCLKRSGLMTVGQVLEKSEDDLLALRNFGRKSYDELRAKLIELGFLQPEPEEEMPLAYEEEEEEGGGVEREEGEPVSALGAALLQALRKVGEDLPTGESEEPESGAEAGEGKDEEE